MIFSGKLWAPQKIGPGVALGSIHSSCRSGSCWPARAEPEFFEVPLFDFDQLRQLSWLFHLCPTRLVEPKGIQCFELACLAAVLVIWADVGLV
jgi:hypothetical protein